MATACDGLEKRDATHMKHAPAALATGGEVCYTFLNVVCACVCVVCW
jgi:hypothetical protein